jgi:hypothetical protein
MMNPSSRDIAHEYLLRGWQPIPVPFRRKNPGFKHWQKLILSEADLPLHFNGQPQNMGVLLGEAAGDLVDVDLDCDEAIALAPRFLLVTGSNGLIVAGPWKSNAAAPAQARGAMRRTKTAPVVPKGTAHDGSRKPRLRISGVAWEFSMFVIDSHWRFGFFRRCNKEW